VGDAAEPIDHVIQRIQSPIVPADPNLTRLVHGNSGLVLIRAATAGYRIGVVIYADGRGPRGPTIARTPQKHVSIAIESRVEIWHLKVAAILPDDVDVPVSDDFGRITAWIRPVFT